MIRFKDLIPQKIKNIYHLGQAILANFIFGFPGNKLIVIGVTGTNGKTTTVHMIAAILEEAGHKVAMASTINFKIGEKRWVNETKFTTLSSFQAQKFLRQAADAKCQYAILETSSHSLDQNRVWGIRYKTAVITNVTREHLDYHHDMEEYRIAKLKLFNQAETAVINLDMVNAKDFLDAGTKNRLGFTTRTDTYVSDFDSGEFEIIKAENINLGINYSNFKVRETEFCLKLPGLFNVENALAAISVAESEKISLDTAKQALEKITGIPGRMEHIPNSRNVDIIIDYAVTPDSLEKLYNLVSLIKKDNSKIISVFGACGERDRGKRPMMGKIVDKYADRIILTNEDPYNENPEQIISDLAQGIKNKKKEKTFWKIMDRREAIKKALQMAEPGDIIAVTGKGAEVTMAVGKQRIPWNDTTVILEELKKL